MNRYRIEPGRSRFTVHGTAVGLFSAFAHNPTFVVREFAGQVRLGATADSLELDLNVNPDSLDLEDRVSDIERREIEARLRSEVLEPSRYRELSYKGRALQAEEVDAGRYRVVIDGDLTLHGATCPHRIDAELIVFADGLRLGGASTLRMSEHGIRPVAALGGTIRMEDALSFTFDIAALPEGP